jgi:hypothetical protein
VKNAKAGQVRYRTDKAGIIHCTIGKADFAEDALKSNLTALLLDLIKAKPATSKGTYLQKVSVSSTMGGRHRRPVVADPEVISSGHGTFGAVTVTFEGIAGSASPAVAVKDRRRGRGNTGDGHGSSIWQGVAAGAVMSA